MGEQYLVMARNAAMGILGTSPDVYVQASWYIYASQWKCRVMGNGFFHFSE